VFRVSNLDNRGLRPVSRPGRPAASQQGHVREIAAESLCGRIEYPVRTARPVQLGYHSVGELVIFLLFGLFPVYGSYYLQTQTIDLIPLLPGCSICLRCQSPKNPIDLRTPVT
jgi:hypothetical protein